MLPTCWSPRAWPGLAVMLLLCAASAAAQDVAPSHRSRGRCSSSAQCSTGSTCACSCRSRHGSAAATAAASSDDASIATHGGGSWLQPGDACALKRTPGQAFARCRPGSFCACSCVASIPVAANDTFAFTDPEGAEGPGLVSVSVLANDASPDGSPVSIAPGSVQSLTPGVTVTSVDEAAGVIDIVIPDGTPSVELRYVPAGSSGQLGLQAYVVGTPATVYPVGACAAGSACGSRAPFLCKNNKGLQCSFTTSATCAAKKFGKQGTYCMTNFKADCASPVNAGCNRCAIYKVMQACAAFNPGTAGYPAPTQSLTQACRYYSKTGGYVIVKSRSVDKTSTATDPETGSNICFMPKHYILMPTEACTGVDDNRKQCTGADSKAYWDGAVRHGYGSGKGDLGFGNTDWAVMINAPDERGQHQMHIHVAPLSPTTAANILIVAKKDNSMEADTSKSPTLHTVNGHTVAAYFFKDTATPPKVAAVDVYNTAAEIHLKYATLKGLTAADVAYGVALIPKAGGFVVAATYGFADINVMDTTITNQPGNCQAACAPFK